MNIFVPVYLFVFLLDFTKIYLLFGSLIIAAAMVINLVTAAFTGAALPLLLTRWNIDPALAGGVVLTTVTDVVGFVSFLGLATLFYA